MSKATPFRSRPPTEHVLDLPAGPRSSVSITTTRVGYRAVITAAGEIDIATIGTFRAALQAVLDSAERDVWLDLADVTFIDATGLHAVLDAHRALEAEYRHLEVIAPPAIFTRMIEAIGLDRMLAVHPDRPSANRAA
jgi:anti-sigma B factor antagonist